MAPEQKLLRLRNRLEKQGKGKEVDAALANIWGEVEGGLKPHPSCDV
jgi:hypothetical protein